MSSPLESLEPKQLWTHFDAIRQIPRPSKHEERVAAHVVAWAEQRGFKTLRDATGNIVVKVPATPGHENAPPVVLQGHLDMVAEKNTDVDFDFMEDPIQVRVDGDWVTAVGTTLGADNGVGVAAAMAMADDPDVVHGPLEILCTMDEETGLTGAMTLDPALLDGRIMLNLDTEEDGAVYIGCAGGADSTAEFPVTRRKALMGSAPFKLAVRGLKGGHSGLNIDENRGNAVKLATRVLLAAIDRGLELDLVSIAGGSKHNAIPRECFAVLRIPADARGELDAVVADRQAAFAEEFGGIEPDLAVTVEELEEATEYAQPMNVHARDHILNVLNGLPHGVLAMSREVPGLVETSNNVAVIRTESDHAILTTSHRSSVMPALFAVQQQVRSICRLGGAKVEVHDAYPGWKPNPDSPIVKQTVAVYEKLFGSRPGVKAIHAGLECGLLLEKVPGMDIVSIGPEIHGAHSPDEKVQISSVQNFYRHLTAVLAELA